MYPEIYARPFSGKDAIIANVRPDAGNCVEVAPGVEEDGETSEEWMLRRTREFNRQLSLEPQQLGLWLRFVEFQDECHRLQRNKNTAPLYGLYRPRVQNVV